MTFATDDIYRLGGSQRAKLQYHVLAQRFPLVHVDEQDKADLEAFAAQADTEAAQLWLARMHWPQGHEKMVTFGQALSVEDKASGGRVKGLWYYKAELDAVKAVYTGFSMSWELWAAPILDYLTEQREARAAAALEINQEVMRLLYYQNGFYLTVPGDIRRAIVKWAYQYLKDGAAPFPFVGDMGSDSYRFTIDFQRDTALKENVNIHADMGAYNAAHNTEKASRRTAKRFADLTGDRWTTAELHAQGFSDRNIKTFCKDGLIRKRYQGHYERNSK